MPTAHAVSRRDGGGPPTASFRLRPIAPPHFLRAVPSRNRARAGGVTWVAMDLKRLLGMVVGFGVLSLLFTALERWRPGIKGQRSLRRGFGLDVSYWFFTPLVTRGITRLALILPAGLLVVLAGVSVEALRDQSYRGYGPLGAQPVWVQALEVFVLADFVGYWMHRLFHRGRWWPFHAVHHSSREVDWLSSVRLHPVNDVVARVAQVLPLMLLGFNPFVLVAYAPVLSLYAIMLHANVNWTFGPLRAVLASPVFHRWHHTKEAEAMDKNFAGFFPLWDILFGTYYMPRDKFPTDFGIAEEMPETLGAQLWWPFRRARAEAAQVATPSAESATRDV